MESMVEKECVTHCGYPVLLLSWAKQKSFRFGTSQIEDDNQLESMLLRAEAITNGELYGFEKTACL